MVKSECLVIKNLWLYIIDISCNRCYNDEFEALLKFRGSELLKLLDGLSSWNFAKGLEEKRYLESTCNFMIIMTIKCQSESDFIN